MQTRLMLFIALSVAIMIGSQWLTRKLYPPAPKPAAQQAKVEGDKPAAEGEKPADNAKPGDNAKQPGDAAIEKALEPKDDAAPAVQPPAAEVAAEPARPEQWVTLGSYDPSSGYRMLVTLTNRGAAVSRAELNSPRYRELDDWDHKGGSLGVHPIESDPPNQGALVPVVGQGTPAAEGGLQAGDVINELDGVGVLNPRILHRMLQNTKVGQSVKLLVHRKGQPHNVTVKLGHRQLSVVEPESDDPLSMLFTIDSLDDKRLSEDDELNGLQLRAGTWEVMPGATPDEAAFRWNLPAQGLEVIKRYKLAKAPNDSISQPDFPAYHLNFTIEIRNIAEAADHRVAYRLDGPTGLPIEGAWYANKIGRNWGAAGMRDFVTESRGGDRTYIGQIYCSTIAEQKYLAPPENPHDIWQPGAERQQMVYAGVNAQYFAAVILPQPKDPQAIDIARWMPIRVGAVPDNASLKNRTNVSCRLVSETKTLKPAETWTQDFRVFLGPKRPSLLANPEYKLGELVYYGWPIFAVVARPMQLILHFFYSIVQNYGLAIIMLTVLVRSCMYPISRKQALNAQKMQELQPEIKKLTEKYKNNLEARSKAQQELFRKHNYNPLSGCLPMFVQLPIFLGLYRSIGIDIELRQAPLLWEGIRWCSNLAAPDMLWYWAPYLPNFLASPEGSGIFNLGPYLNILPLATVALFVWQQKMFMPPPADEQAALQQKMMQYMMIFIGIMFFKVASGLCIYFIASSLWGIAERKLLPKPPAPGTVTTPSTVSPWTSGNGSGGGSKKKQRGPR